MSYFGTQTVSQAADAFSHWLPSGGAFGSTSVEGTTANSLIRGIVKGELRREAKLNDDIQRVIVGEQGDVERWEKALNIPDGVYPGTGTLAERGNHVVAKLSERFIHIEADMIWFATLFGLTVTIAHGSTYSTFPLTLPVLLFDTITDARFTLIIVYSGGVIGGFPYTLPLTFSDTNRSIFEAAMRRIIPINYRLQTVFGV